MNSRGGGWEKGRRGVACRLLHLVYAYLADRNVCPTARLTLHLSHSALHPFIDKSPPFAFGAGEREGRDTADVDLEAELKVQFLSDAGGVVEVVFDFDEEFVHRAVFAGGHSVFDDLGETVQDVLDRGGVDVH